MLISMNGMDELAIQTRISTVLPTLNEYQRRRYLSAEAKAIGYGGISIVSRLSGMSRQTLTEGVKEIGNPDAEVMKPNRSRKAGGGRKPVWEACPGILEKLDELVSAHTKGDPMCSLLWTNKSLRNLMAGLNDEGFEVCHRVVGEMLKKLGYGLQSDKKTLTVKPAHADRDEQFEYINKETRRRRGLSRFLTMIFRYPNLAKRRRLAFTIFKNQGFVSVGISADTAAFAVEFFRRWWFA